MREAIISNISQTRSCPVYFVLLYQAIKEKVKYRNATRLATSRPFQSEKVIWSDEVARASASDVSVVFTCRNVSQSVNFWPEKKDWHF